MFIEKAMTDPFFYFGWIVFVMFSVCCHEYAHAYTALRFGDDTAERSGHLTLNPLIQMGVSSIVMLALFGLAWGAVPVNNALVRSPYKRAMISLAGPLSNLLLCFIFSFLLFIATAVGADDASSLLLIAGAVNGMLFVFNMLPIPMLDGFAVIAAFHLKLQAFAQQYASVVFLVFVLLLWNSSLGQIIFALGYGLEALFIHFWQTLFSVFM